MHSLSTIIKTATGVTCHSNEVRPGNIFVAIRGRTLNGNDYACAAIKQGASSIVSDAPETLPLLPVPVICVPNARQACAWLAAQFYHNPSRELSLAGVTGTNGKTTIASMLHHIYLTAGFRSGMIGTVKVELGDCSIPSKLTTPDSISLQQYLRRMRNRSVTHAVMEVSAQGMELNRVDQVQFACGILSNICPDHLDFHGDFSSYLAAKRLFPALLDGAPLIINAADPHCRAIAEGYTDGAVITAGIDTVADITARVLRTNRIGSVFEIRFSRQPEWLTGSLEPFKNVRLPAPGLHNVENALLSIVAALYQGVSPQAIVSALASFGGVERRFSVCQHGGCTVIDDTALNPGSIDAVFQTIQEFRYNRLVVVNAIRGRRGTAINKANAETLARWQAQAPFSLIVTASHDQTTYADEVTYLEKTSFLHELDRLQARYIYTETLSEAINAARAVTQPGDLLLLIGAQGMDHGYSLLANQSAFTEVSLALPQ